MRRSLRAAGLGRHESGPSSSDHQDPVSPPIAPPSWVPDPPPMDPGQCIFTRMYNIFSTFANIKPTALQQNKLSSQYVLAHIPVIIVVVTLYPCLNLPFDL